MELMSTPEAARAAEVSEKTIREAIRAGQLEAVVVGGGYVIRDEDLQVWVENFLDADEEDEGDEEQEDEDEESEDGETEGE